MAVVVNAALRERGRPGHSELAELEVATRVVEPTPVAEAIARLPERQPLALFLRYYADLDYESIATALEVSTGRRVRKLRRELGFLGFAAGSN